MVTNNLYGLRMPVMGGLVVLDVVSLWFGRTTAPAPASTPAQPAQPAPAQPV